jgi:hypothetical protein
MRPEAIINQRLAAFGALCRSRALKRATSTLACERSQIIDQGVWLTADDAPAVMPTMGQPRPVFGSGQSAVSAATSRWRNADECDLHKKPPNTALMVRSGPWRVADARERAFGAASRTMAASAPSFPPSFEMAATRPPRRMTVSAAGRQHRWPIQKSKTPAGVCRRAQFTTPDFENISRVVSRQAEGAISSR